MHRRSIAPVRVERYFTLRSWTAAGGVTSAITGGGATPIT
jgi:hypothetical protein